MLFQLKGIWCIALKKKGYMFLIFHKPLNFGNWTPDRAHWHQFSIGFWSWIEILSPHITLISHHSTKNKTKQKNPTCVQGCEQREEKGAGWSCSGCSVWTLQEEEQCLKILLLFWASKCQGANVFTVHASGLASDCGYLSVHKCARLQTQTHTCARAELAKRGGARGGHTQENKQIWRE